MKQPMLSNNNQKIITQASKSQTLTQEMTINNNRTISKIHKMTNRQIKIQNKINNNRFREKMKSSNKKKKKNKCDIYEDIIMK